MSELQDLFEQSNPIPKGITRCGDHYAQTEYMLIDPYASNYAARFKGFMEGVKHQQTIIDNLKTQLNNMEACYIEKKKECEDQQSKIDELNQHIKRLESKLDSLGADRQELVGQVNDLQKQNAWLSDVAERENNRANNLQQDKTSTTILLGKTIQEKNKLQKRINEALVCVDQAKDGFYGFSCEGGDTDNLAKHLEKALRGDND